MGFMSAGKSISRVLDKMGIDHSSEQGMFMARQMMEGMNGGRLPIKEVHELGEKALRSYKNAEAAFSTTPEKVSRYGTFENSLRAERNADAGKKVLDTHRANLSKDKARLEELKAERAGLTGSDEIYAFNERNKEEIEQLQNRIKDNPITKIEAKRVKNNKSTPKRESASNPEQNGSAQEDAQNAAENQKQSLLERGLEKVGLGPNPYQKGNASNIDAAFSKESGNHFNASIKDLENAEDFGRVGKQKIERITNDRKNLEADLRGAKDQEDFNKILKDKGISAEGNLGDNISKHYDEQLRSNATMGDVFNAYHGPKIVGAGIIGASVLKMSDNRGRVPNSQLYSDPF